MPDWCYNTVYVSGSKEDIEKIKEINFDFNKIIPMPQSMYDDSNNDLNLGGQSLEQVKREYPNHPEYAKLIEAWIKEFDCDGWYSWSSKHWGVKWSASNVEIDSEGNYKESGDYHVTYTFDTPWGQPEPILKELSNKFPKCLFECSYNMEGSDPCMSLQAGEIVG